MEDSKKMSMSCSFDEVVPGVQRGIARQLKMEFLPSQPCAYVNPHALLRLAPYHYH
jgi:hypothetical protein